MDVMTTMRNTDWRELQRQKMELLRRTKDDDALMMGLVHFLDAVQDAVVAEGIASEGEVFPQIDD